MSDFSSDLLMNILDGDSEEVKEMAKMLNSLGPQMIEEIEEAINNKNWENAGTVAHKLKSSLKLWQMEDLVDLAVFIEINGVSSSNHEDIINKFAELKKGFNIVLIAMQEKFNL